MKIKILIYIICLLATATSVFAQVGAGGGGLMKESDLQTYMDRIDDFMTTEEGKAAFPEIAVHDHLAKESFHAIVKATFPKMVNERPRDQFNQPKTCVSHADSSGRYFKCYQPDFNDSLENSPRVYKIILHELFVQSEIEKPHDVNVSSEYKISSRILKHLFKDEAWGWMPGSLPKDPVTQSGLWCTDQPSLLEDEIGPQLRTKIIFWDPTGEVRFIEISQGKAKTLFHGLAPLPKDCQQATVPFELRGAGFKYAPLQRPNFKNDRTLWFATNENLVLRSMTTSDGHSWTQILGDVFLQGDGPIRQTLVACQSLKSWKESVLYPYVTSILEKSKK